MQNFRKTVESELMFLLHKKRRFSLKKQAAVHNIHILQKCYTLYERWRPGISRDK